MAKQKYTEAKKNSNLKWDAANLDRISIALPKGSRETIKSHATTQGESTNAFIKRAIDGQIARDSAGGHQEAAGAAKEGGGISIIYPDTLKRAQEAAERTGEDAGAFMARAVKSQAKRDEKSLAMGINPAAEDGANP